MWKAFCPAREPVDDEGEHHPPLVVGAVEEGADVAALRQHPASEGDGLVRGTRPIAHRDPLPPGDHRLVAPERRTGCAIRPREPR